MKKSKLLNLRKLIVETSATLDDTEALTGVELFRPWSAGISVTKGERLRYGTDLYRVEQDHTTQADWTPDITPALYTKVAEPGEIPVWRQPTGAQDAYMTGDKVWFPEKDTTVYESLIDNNVYSPEAYPAGWEVVE